VTQKSIKEKDEPTSGDTERAPYQVLSDTPSTSMDQDHLDFLPYATALATLIDRKATSTPLIAAISAPWGAGKTTLSELVQEQLRALGEWDDPHIICRFNAWKHDDAPYLGAAFAAEVAQRANCYRHWWRRLIQPLPSIMLTPEQRWRRKCYIILISLALAIGLVLGTKTRDLIAAAAHPTGANWTAAEHAVHGWGPSLLVIFAAIAFIYPKVFAGTQSVARFITDPQSEAAQGSMNAVRKQLGNLIHSASRKDRRFIIFVDDLERCRPPRAVEVCEVASQLLDHHGVITVLVGDMEAIAMSAAIKYRGLELPNTDQTGGEAPRTSYWQYGRAYLQKIVTIQFDLPPATPDQLKNMLRADQADTPDVDRTMQAANIAALALMVAVGLSLLALIAFSSNVIELLASAAAGGLLGVILPIVEERRKRTRTRVTRERIDQAIQDQTVGTTADQAAENVAKDAGGSTSDGVRKRYLNAVLDTTGIVARADNLVFEFLPNRPRGAKRLLNQVRLMLLISTGRGLFMLQSEGDQNQRADLIGKWLVLRERWPEIAQLVQRDPKKMKDLENIADNNDKDALETLLGMPQIVDLGDLLRLLVMKPHFEDLNELINFSGTTAERDGSATS